MMIMNLDYIFALLLMSIWVEVDLKILFSKIFSQTYLWINSSFK